MQKDVDCFSMKGFCDTTNYLRKHAADNESDVDIRSITFDEVTASLEDYVFKMTKIPINEILLTVVCPSNENPSVNYWGCNFTGSFSTTDTMGGYSTNHQFDKKSKIGMQLEEFLKNMIKKKYNVDLVKTNDRMTITVGSNVTQMELRHFVAYPVAVIPQRYRNIGIFIKKLFDCKSIEDVTRLGFTCHRIIEFTPHAKFDLHYSRFQKPISHELVTKFLVIPTESVKGCFFTNTFDYGEKKDFIDNNLMFFPFLLKASLHQINDTIDISIDNSKVSVMNKSLEAFRSALSPSNFNRRKVSSFFENGEKIMEKIFKVFSNFMKLPTRSIGYSLFNHINSTEHEKGYVISQLLTDEERSNLGNVDFNTKLRNIGERWTTERKKRFKKIKSQEEQECFSNVVYAGSSGGKVLCSQGKDWSELLLAGIIAKQRTFELFNDFITFKNEDVKEFYLENVDIILMRKLLAQYPKKLLQLKKYVGESFFNNNGMFIMRTYEEGEELNLIGFEKFEIKLVNFTEKFDLCLISRVQKIRSMILNGKFSVKYGEEMGIDLFAVRNVKRFLSGEKMIDDRNGNTSTKLLAEEWELDIENVLIDVIKRTEEDNERGNDRKSRKEKESEQFTKFCRKLVKDEETKDLGLKTFDKKIIKVHKRIMITCDYFQERLLIEDKNIVELNMISYLLIPIIQFIYTKGVYLNGMKLDHLVMLSSQAEKFRMNKLKKLVDKTILKRMDLEKMRKRMDVIMKDKEENVVKEGDEQTSETRKRIFSEAFEVKEEEEEGESQIPIPSAKKKRKKN